MPGGDLIPTAMPPRRQMQSHLTLHIEAGGGGTSGSGRDSSHVGSPSYLSVASTPTTAEPPSPSAVSDISLSRSPRGLLVCFKDVSYSIPVPGEQKKTLIAGITGCFEPGQMTAVMGPSGSGKTTLLDALAGRKNSGTLSGSVLFGGLPPSRSLLRRAAGYVEQFDTLVDTLTCYEMLLYTAQLKRPRAEPRADKQHAVEQLLMRLGLAGCARTVIGSPLKRGVSGGQAKRLNIGIALITDPRVLFLDEPTSGLDSYTANEVMSVVASLAARDGTTVATTIHSPSAYAFGLFDKLLVLDGGRTVYLGPAGDPAIGYFVDACGARQPRIGDNLAEWMLDSVAQFARQRATLGAAGKSKGRSLASRYARSQLARHNEALQGALNEEASMRRARSATLQELSRLAAAEEGDAGLLGPLSEPLACCSCSCLGGGGGGWWWLGRGGSASSGSSSSFGSSFFGGSGSGGSGSGSGSSFGARRRAGGSSFGGGCAYVTPAWWGLRVLLSYRTARNYRTPMYVLPRLLEKLLFAAVVLSLYWAKGTDFSTLNVPVLSSLMFLMVLAPICAAMMYLPSMATERALFIRERNDGLYRPVTYLAFKLLDELALMAPVTAATTAAVFFACKLQGSWLLFWLVHYATLANGTALAYFLASVSPGLMVAMPVLSFVLIMMLILCGFMIRSAAVPAYWAWALKANVVHYSWGALMMNQYGAGTGGTAPKAKIGGMGVLTYFGFGGADPWAYLGVVGGCFAFWAVLAWLALSYARTHRR